MNAATRKLRKPIKVEYRQAKLTDEQEAARIGITLERLKRLREIPDAQIDEGDDRRGTRRYTFQECPLERAYSRKALHPTEYTALIKFRHHWYHGDLAPHCNSVDLNRIFAADFGSMSHMPKSERQAHHRGQYRLACAAISNHPDGHKIQIVVDNVVCSEQPLHIAGFAIGYSSPHRARQGAERRLCSAGDILSRLWGK